jgi:acetate kinase
LEFLGITLDESRNRAAKLSVDQPIALISQEAARVRVLAVRADEELAMAREAAHALTRRR